MQVEGWWIGQAAAQTSGGGATLVYFLGAGETGGMRPRTLICAAHHLRALCRLIIDLQFVLRSDLGTDLKSRTRLDQRSDTANHNIWWSNF